MNEENILVITDREELYNKCENMEQLFDKYYLPLLDKHYSKTYKLQQENARLKDTFEKIRNYIKEHDYDYIYLDCKFLETQIYNDLLQMLNKIKEN